MNQNRRPIDKQTRKKMEKQVKKGQKELSSEELPRTDELTPEEALSKYPKKRQKAEKPLMDSTVKGMEIKKKKKQAKHSKRTTPGEVDHRESPPAAQHKEGQRWEKTLTKQNQGKRKALTSKLQKNKKKI